MSLAGTAWGQAILDVAAVPALNLAGRASYSEFLLMNLPRAFALGSQGTFGWSGGEGTAEQMRAKALATCASKGGTDCRVYAENLDVVWSGPAPVRVAPPRAFLSTWNYELVPDDRYFWRGPAVAAGAYLWAHGYSSAADYRGQQPQGHVRAFNNAGFDVVRFDRVPNADGDPVRTAGWMEDSIAELRRQGYRRVVVGGQSRGAWNALMMLSHPGLADAVIAISPAAHGSGNSPNLTAQYDDLRQMVDGLPATPTRLAFVQFEADPFAGDLAGRLRLIERLRGRVGALLVVDRPPGFQGHGAGVNASFAKRFGPCLLRFVMEGVPAC